MNWKAARTSLLLSLLFVPVYVGTNWLASRRDHVGSLNFEWERHIPFVPLAIVPYMSIDLFFIAAPFLCRTDRERRTLASRIAAAILIAGTCFLLFPLRFGFERPDVDGWLGAVFNAFRTMDRPFNELPSLHIALGAILSTVYARRLHEPWRSGVVVWFVLIGLSAVLTYQHHVIDVAGGLALAAFCFYLFPHRPEGRPAVKNDRVGWYYTAGALAFIAGSIIARPWSWVLLWPAASLGWTATAYFGARNGASIYRKSDGRLPATTWLLLWPVLLGQRLSLAHYARQCRPWDRLTDRVWIGRKLYEGDARRAIAEGVTAVLDLTEEFSETRPFLSLTYLHLPVLDLTPPTHEQLDQAIAFIQRSAQHGVVYIHCKIGYSRTAAVAGAYLLASGAAKDVDEALKLLRTARPTIVIRPEALEAMHACQARLANHGSSTLIDGQAPSHGA